MSGALRYNNVKRNLCHIVNLQGLVAYDRTS